MAEQQPEYPMESCRAIVDQVIQRYGWQLLAEDDYVAQVAAVLQTGEVRTLWAAAIHVYCRALFAACRGDEGPDRQNLAFEELYRYLYALSFREMAALTLDERKDATDEALLRIWRRMPVYRKPAAFLAIAAFELRTVVRPLWQRAVPTVSFEDVPEEMVLYSDGDLLGQAMKSELRKEVQASLDDALRRHPRKRKQIEAVMLKFITELDDKAIAAYLDISVEALYVARSRGLRWLYDEPALQAAAADLGIEVHPRVEVGRGVEA